MSLTLEMPTAKAPKRKSKFALILVLLFIVGFGGFFAWIYSGRIVSENGELSAGFIPASAPMSSVLAEVLVQPNAYVQKGQLLAKLDAGDYLQQMAAAQALVKGAVSAESSAERVAAAQKATEEMVERIALARHEESARKSIVEQRSIEHARAQLKMRDLDAKGGTEAQKAAARKEEFNAQRNLQSAKAAFDHASQSRSAIESELHKIRNSQNFENLALISASHKDPTLIHAPVNGYLTKNIPLAGKVVTRDEAVFQIIPESNAKLVSVAILPKADAEKLPTGTLCYVKPSNGWNIFAGKVGSIDISADMAHISINLESVSAKGQSTPNSATRTVFWAHPLTDSEFLKPLFMLLSYLPF